MEISEYTITETFPVNAYSDRVQIGKQIFSRLHPFLPAIKEALKRKGTNIYGLKNRYAAGYFINHFIDNNYDPETFINNPLFSAYASEIDDSYRNNFQVRKFEHDVDSIINIFIQAKEKYLSLRSVGANPKKYMTDIDYLFAVTTLRIQEKLLSDEQADHFVKKGNLTLLYVVVIVILLFQLSK